MLDRRPQLAHCRRAAAGRKALLSSDIADAIIEAKGYGLEIHALTRRVRANVSYLLRNKRRPGTG
jgi:hypothetical protein